MDTIIYMSGTRWDSLPGTDKMLARSLSRSNNVLWVDHPVPLHGYADVRCHLLRSLRGAPEDVEPDIARLRVPALPGVSKPVVRHSTDAVVRRCIDAAIRRADSRIAGIVNASPIMLFPSQPGGTRLLHLTDDWLAGASLMGFAPSHLLQVLQANIRSADVISAVSEGLAAKISKLSGRPVEVLPNGCGPAAAPNGTERRPVVALVGQLTRRLDLDMLESVAETNVPLLVIGPRADEDPAFRSRLDAILTRPNVDWRGLTPQDEVTRLLHTVAVGITPYADTEFNRSSFPLKTLEYLSAGLRVVATDLPSTRWIDSPAIARATSPAMFTRHVLEALHQPMSPELRHDVRAVASAHSWDARATTIERFLSGEDQNRNRRGAATDLLPPGDATTDRSAAVDHVLLTRFNLPSKGFESLIRAKDGWLRERVELFEKYCVPSVRAQTEKAFHWIVYFDPESPEWLTKRIHTLNTDGIFTPVFRAEVSTDELLEDIAHVTGRRSPELLTSNVDNDDGLAVDFVARVQAADCEQLPTAIYLASGLVKEGPSVYLRRDHRNAFCSVRSVWSAPATCWSAWHDQLGKAMAIKDIDGPPAWLQSVHGSNVSNRVRGRLVSPRPFVRRFPGLLDDAGSVTSIDLVRDALFRRPSRMLRDTLRSAVKAAIVRLLGPAGIDKVKVLLRNTRRENTRCK
ncbi:glycosyltransferase [Paenarthrobacter sp. NPDC089322]|uniref:glycosyltransferase n=1 Tax=Paenarthrobacter sp. NPDC089322 TaxID=3155065 RepID=UPI003414647F